MASRTNKSRFNSSSQRVSRSIDAPLDADGRAALHISVRKGDVISLKRLLKLHADPQQQDSLGQTALYSAIAAQDIAMVRLLIEGGGSFRVEDDQERTPLMWALEQRCSVDFLQQLHLLGAELDIQNSAGRQAIHFAAENNLSEVIGYFVESGISVDAVDQNGKTPLYLATEKKAHGALRKLLDCGANPLVRTNEIRTSLHIAASLGDEAAIDILLAQPFVKHEINSHKTYAEGFTPLMAAVQANNLPIAEKLINAGADPDQRDSQNRHSLFIAVEAGYLEMAKLLIRSGADVEKGPCFAKDTVPMLHVIPSSCYNDLLLVLYAAGANLDAVDRNGQSALFKASDNANKEKAGALLKLGANVNLSDKFGCRPLDAAVERSYYSSNDTCDVVRLLLENHADPNISSFPNAQESPLHIAVRAGHKEIVELLLAHNAVVDEPDRDHSGSTPFMRSLEYGYYDISQMLLKKGADLLRKDNNLRGVLHFVARQGSQKQLDLFLQISALKQQIDSPDSNGFTPLHHAVLGRSADSVETFLKAGADIYTYDRAGMTPLHYVVSGGESNMFSVFEDVLGKKVNWNIQNRNNGDALLHIAAQNNGHAIIDRLLKLNADISVKNNQGLTALHVAIIGRGEVTVHMLIDYMKLKKINPDRDRDSQGWAALHHAAHRSMLASIPVLLEAGADVNVSTPEGDTPLHVAVRAGHEDAVEALIKAGANASAVNAAGKTSLHIALEMRRTDLAELLAKTIEKQKNNSAFPAPKAKFFQPPKL